MIALLIFSIVVCVVAGICIWAVRMLPIAAPFNQLVVVAIVLVALLIWLERVYPSMLGG